MAFTYGFYDSVGGDRTYNSSQLSELVDGIITDGIFALIGTAMRVTNPGGLDPNVGIGRAWFNGTWSKNDSVMSLTCDPADALLPRRDAVVLEVDTSPGTRANSIKILKGTPATTPVYPTLASGVYKNGQLLLESNAFRIL